MSWRELGQSIGLGPTATADRVRRLESIWASSGAIRPRSTCRRSAWGFGRSPRYGSQRRQHRGVRGRARQHPRGADRDARHRRDGLRAAAGLPGRADARPTPHPLAHRGRGGGELVTHHAARGRAGRVTDPASRDGRRLCRLVPPRPSTSPSGDGVQLGLGLLPLGP